MKLISNILDKHCNLLDIYQQLSVIAAYT